MNLQLRAKRKGGKAKPTLTRRRDAVRTKAEILNAGAIEFSQRGLSGARVDRIASRMRSNKRMIYYYFKSKERLYLAVLEDAYRKMREAEGQLNLDALVPEEAIKLLVEFTFDYHFRNPQFARLVTIENVHQGKHLARLDSMPTLNTSIIDVIARVLRRGAEAGQFRTDIDPVKLHMTISALCLFQVTNRHTFGTIFKCDMVSDEAKRMRRKELVEIIIRSVKA